eukprot:1285186-Amphidinium_carterae.1
MAGSNNAPDGPATNWWENTVSPFAPVPSHISIASSQPLSSVGTLPVSAPRALAPGSIERTTLLYSGGCAAIPCSGRTAIARITCSARCSNAR